jgi:cytoskeletal protein CcmA (bactofilin family)
MWNKSSEAKPSSQASNAPAPIPGQTFPSSSGAPASQAVTPVPVSSPASAATVAPASRAGSSTIAGGLKIRGDVTGDSDLFIDGEAHGKINLPTACVTVGPHGRVHADIEAREIVIHGVAQGTLAAVEGVRLGSSGHFQGIVLTPRIAIEEGARFNGKVEMTRGANARFVPEAVDSENLGHVSARSGTE